MNAEALIGTVLGTCTLQKLIGQGGMGAVFLAQQSRPRRQVAIKVLLPMTPLSPNQLAAFLERFRRETDAAASLEHPNIMPVHEYGERDGLAYLVMPYISGGTLRDELEREGQLGLAKAANYLDQMAAALDFAHEHKVIHRDIKPANILMTPEGRLLLTDFGLVKIIDDRHAAQVRLTGAGAPVGTPDYMAPEQVIGEEVDGRADLYSLGVILYQMLTGTTPFQGDTPMQIAAQHLQLPPPSPQALRPDLPAATEQVILRSLAKRPADRYMRAQDLANAFRMSLMGTGIPLGTSSMPSVSVSSATSGRLFTPKGVPGPSRLTGTMPTVSGRTGMMPSVTKGAIPAANVGNSSLLSRTGMMPAATGGTAPNAGGSGLLSRTGKFPQVGTGALPAAMTSGKLATPAGDKLSPTGAQPVPGITTGTLMVPKQPGANTVKLTGPVKVVQVPVAGQPGRYVTGILPIVEAPETRPDKPRRKLRPWVKIAMLVIALLLVIGGSLEAFLFVRSHPFKVANQATGNRSTVTGALSVADKAMAQATATAQANIILSDPLSTNIHNWLVTPPDVYVFKGGAYHITDRGNNGRAAVLLGQSFSGPIGYTLTMQEVNGDDGSANNSFGMIFRFNQQSSGGNTVTTFYSFEVVNMKGGEYQFWKYDDSKGMNTSPWTKIWSAPFGNEFHQGHGAQSANTFKVFMNGGTFTIMVNGKALNQTVKDGTFANGMVGMIVNLNGTEVAFSNLLLTRN